MSNRAMDVLLVALWTLTGLAAAALVAFVIWNEARMHDEATWQRQREPVAVAVHCAHVAVREALRGKELNR